MNEFIAAIIAHDSTCEPGDEWMLHGMAEDKKGKPVVKKDVDGAKIECVVFCVILVVEIGFVIWCILTH